MKARTLLLLLAAIGASSPAAAAPCGTLPARTGIAEKLRLAAEQHPVHITFRTQTDGVKVPEYLKQKYPDEMTIVMQHEFRQLYVVDDRFDVVLWFKGYPERITVPFNAITAFWEKDELVCRSE